MRVFITGASGWIGTALTGELIAAGHEVVGLARSEASAEKIRALEQALARYQAGGSGEFSNFRTAVEAYAQFHWDHMRVEETELLPLAEKYLTAADWLEIDTAFLGHTDPLLGAEVGARYDTLFSRIVNLAPPPIGLGPET